VTEDQSGTSIVQQLEEVCRLHLSPIKQRAALIALHYAQGLPTREVAQKVGISRSRARYWRRQFQQKGLALFNHEPESDKQVELSQDNPAESISEQELEMPLVLGDEPVVIKKIKSPAGTDLPDQAMLDKLAKIKTAGVAADDVLAEAGRKVLRYHFIQMLANEDSTRLGEDIEGLHDMRVATRRMRAAFEVFAVYFQPKVVKTHLKGLRATGRALGNVRDLDVFIDKAQKYICSRPESEHNDLQPLVAAWLEQRDNNRMKMLVHLDSDRYQYFKKKFYTFLNTPGMGVNDTQQSPCGRVRELAPVLIYERLACVRVFDVIAGQATLEQLHALRIDFKKLRYTLEFFREVLGDEIGVVISEIKRIQDHLGDLNDAQVATQILRDFLVEWDFRQQDLPVEQRKSPDPVITYLSSRYAERQRLMLGFKEVWDKFNRVELREKLAQAVAVL